MAKNIVICSDGTGNSAVKGRGTNVFKIFESVDLNGHRFDPQLVPQIAIYDDGVGTEDFKPLKIVAGATGYGLGRNVRQLYKELCRIYDPGDRIFLFGFSRGAFTVRTLAGLICRCGIIDARAPGQGTARAFERTVRAAYDTYRRGYRTALMQLILGPPDDAVVARFRLRYCHRNETRIAFIGVWDTVDAVGLPLHIADFVNTAVYRFKFPDRKLSDRVERACHALAIDDERHSFHPLLWDELGAGGRGGQEIRQVWFAGAHSNVGGGYPKQGLSLVALDWMMQQAREAGLRFVEPDAASFAAHANVDDKLYDPRAGVGVFYRWKPRDIAAICRESSVPPVVHLSVLERIAHGTEDYAPGVLPPNATVAITPTGDPAKDATALQRAKEVERVLQSAHADGRPLLSRVNTALLLGRSSYYICLFSSIALLVAAATPPGEQSTWQLWPFVQSTGQLVLSLATSPIDTLALIIRRLQADPSLFGALLGGFAAAYVLKYAADRRMGLAFSEFWHKQQQRLRDALKRARRVAAEGEGKSTPRLAPVAPRAPVAAEVE
jgi:uncharacterized protein (DUF2235 family)